MLPKFETVLTSLPLLLSLVVLVRTSPLPYPSSVTFPRTSNLLKMATFSCSFASQAPSLPIPSSSRRSPFSYPNSTLSFDGSLFHVPQELRAHTNVVWWLMLSSLPHHR
jgi:hypothetical protein